MAEPAFSINFTARIEASEECEPGDAILYDSSAGLWKIATAAARAALGKRAEAVALSYYSGAVIGKVAYQMTGVLANEISELGAGAAYWVRAADDGRLERVATPGVGDDLVGKSAVDGRVALDMGKWDNTNFTGAGAGFEDLDAEPGQVIRRNVDGTAWTAEDVAEIPSGIVNAPVGLDGAGGLKNILPPGIQAGSVLYWDGTKIAGIPIGTEAQVLAVGIGLGLTYVNQTVSSGFDPASLALTTWCEGDATEYNGAPWTGIASAGTSGSNSLLDSASTVPGTGSTVDGFAPATFTGNDRLYGPAANATFGSSTGFIIVLAKPTAATADGGGSTVSLPGLFGVNAAGVLQMSYSTAGLRASVYDQTAAAYVECNAIAATLNNWHVFAVRYTGTEVQSSVDGSLFSANSKTAGPPPSVSAAVWLGSNASASSATSEIMGEMTGAFAITQSQLANVIARWKAKYPSMGLP